MYRRGYQAAIEKDIKLIMPYFVIEGGHKKEPVLNMPGIFRLSVDNLLKDVEEAKQLGITRFLLFGVCPRSYKNELATYAFAEGGIIPQAVAALKQKVKGLTIFTDVCLCAYTSHGHCGILKSPSHQFIIDNKKTLEALSKTALAHAQAGADWVAPSAMAKKQVLVIRKALDENGFRKVKILGYSAKFVSSFYGPFRNAANSSPAFGDRSGYQLDYSNKEKALSEIADDIKEGADMVMVKPALSYLDIIREAKDRFNFPLAAFNVSGEYAFVKYGAKRGLWEEKKMVREIIASIKRAGGYFIITYHAKDIAKWAKLN